MNTTSVTNDSGYSTSASAWKPYPVARMKSSNTADCNTKSTSATPTTESGRISRGNATFFTRFPLSITDRVPLPTATENRFHASKPESRNTG